MADLQRYPAWSGDKVPTVPYISEVNNELWERHSLARKECLDKLGLRITVVSGFRPREQQQALWNCYQGRLQTGVCKCTSCNLAAAPGSSNHEMGLALDLSPGVRSIPKARDIYYKYGLIFPVIPEDWHAEMDRYRKPLPDQPPILTPPQGNADMATISAHSINGITVEAEILFPTIIRLHWNDAGHPIWPYNDWVLLRDLGVPEPPQWVNSITVGEMLGRFCIVMRDTNTHLAWAAYQKDGTSGAPYQWERQLYPAK